MAGALAEQDGLDEHELSEQGTPLPSCSPQPTQRRAGGRHGSPDTFTHTSGPDVESGLNHGICVPLLLIAIAIAEAEEAAIGNGAALHLVLEEISYGCVGGQSVAGLAGSRWAGTASDSPASRRFKE